jgi:hypothetical protein
LCYGAFWRELMKKIPVTVTREVLMDLLKVYGSNLEKELEGYELIIVD